jgi:hypothetical protein
VPNIRHPHAYALSAQTPKSVMAIYFPFHQRGLIVQAPTGHDCDQRLSALPHRNGRLTNDVMDRHDVGLAYVESDLGQDGHERLAECCEGRFGFPDVVDH